MTDVLLLWHMHQPRYVHPATGRPALPWVRLHAASGYLDMARALERRPGARVTVNFVPSLIDQLTALEAGTRDELERLAELPADGLTEAEAQTVSARSFSVHWGRGLEPRARYRELASRRVAATSPGASKAARFTPAELRDLQCLFLLAWSGFAAREDDPALEALDAKGRNFSEADKATLVASTRRAAVAALPAWRKLAERGQVELASSPYYHPIVPLLIDSEAARRARPDDTLPTRFAFPEDAKEQIESARRLHEATFGTPPRGMWPPEGSLSPEAVRLYAENGIQWLAGDEETLARSLGGHGGRAHAGLWRHENVTLFFRDRDLSDRIGFRYADKPAHAAAEDLLAGARSLGGDGGVANIFLDGENAWEGFPRRGADFLDALYAGLEAGEKSGRLRSRTVGETMANRGPGTNLERLHSGSWIDASFRIWIGDPVKNRAWEQLRRAREALRSAPPSTKPADLARARQLLLAAEGSDWFWWFGEPFTSAEDPLFDELFRAHLEAAWRALGQEPPAELFEPVASESLATPHAAAPTAMLKPHLDGKRDRFYEWAGAARYELGRGAAMAESAPPPVVQVHVGFDREHLYLRLDPARLDRRRVGASKMRLRLRTEQRDVSLSIQVGAPDGGPELRAAGGRVAAQDVVEVALPFAFVGAGQREEISLWMTLEFAGLVFARIPRDGVLRVTTPWPGWEAENWRV